MTSDSDPLLTVPSFSITLGLLRITLSVGTLFCLGVFRWLAHDRSQTSKVCTFLHLWLVDFYGELWHSQRSLGTLEKHVYNRSHGLYHHVFGIHDFNLIPHLYQGRNPRLYVGLDGIGGAIGGFALVFS